jgi:hypothetical protein
VAINPIASTEKVVLKFSSIPAHRFFMVGQDMLMPVRVLCENCNFIFQIDGLGVIKLIDTFIRSTIDISLKNFPGMIYFLDQENTR